MQRFISFFGLFFVLFVVFPAYAEDPKPTSWPIKELEARLVTDRLKLSKVKFPEIFDKEHYKNLKNGFSTIVLIRVYLYNKNDDSKPIASSLRHIKIIYDPWDEIYDVQLNELDGEKQFFLTTKSEVLTFVTTLSNFPLYLRAPLSPSETYFLAVIAEINPISEELRLETKKWLARAASSRSKSSNSSSFFGSFVAIFVNIRPGDAERTSKFRSHGFSPSPKKK